MRELAKSMASFSWAMSLFGVQQLENSLGRQTDLRRQSARTEAAFYTVTIAMQEQFGNLMRAGFQAGDELQRGLINRTFDLLTLEAFNPNNPNNLLRLTANLAEQSAETFRVLTPGAASSAAWRELQNKLEVFDLVKDARHSLQITSATHIPLVQTVRRAYDAGPYPALWLIEGLGHDYTDTYWKRRLTPHRILSDVSDLPEKSLTMLHAGLGLSVAQHLIRKLTPQTSSAEVRSTLHRFIGLCQDNSESGYEGAAYESLGLVARNIYPQLVRVVDEELGRMNRQVQAYFWHGVGRAIYFSALYFVPGLFSPWQAVEREAPHELAWLNAIAGLTWAVVEVNIKNPEVMESLLQYQGAQLSRTDAFANGISSGIIMRYDTTPDAAFTEAWCQYEPDRSDTSLVRLWHSQVRRSCQDALDYYYPILKKQQRLGEVFRYQSLPALVKRLKS